MPLSRQSVGTYQETGSHATLLEDTQPQSSQLAEPLWTDPGLRSGISVCDLISTKKKKKKKAQAEMNCRTFSQTFSREEKTTTCSVRSLCRLGRWGNMRDDSAEILSQSILREAIMSSSGMGRGVHSLTLSIQHFPRLRVSCRVPVCRIVIGASLPSSDFESWVCVSLPTERTI